MKKKSPSARLEPVAPQLKSATSSLSAPAPGPSVSAPTMPALVAAIPPSASPPSASSLSASSSVPAVLSFAPGAPCEVRVAVIGNVDSGKSTLVGVLTGGEMDDGRGSARLRVAVHQHESSSGRTSCISQHIVGFNEKKQPVFQPAAQSASAAAKDKGWRHVVTHSQSIVNFIDLAGHQRYLKTTVAGLTGWFPHYALLVVNSLAGITRMTKEHLSLVLALNIPFLVVVSKVDMCPENVFLATKKQLWKALKSSDVNKMPINVRSEKDVATCLAAPADKIAPVFFVSSVSGVNLDLLSNYISGLRPRSLDLDKLLDGAENKKEGKEQQGVEDRKEEKKEKKENKGAIRFEVDHTYSVSGVGLVVSGTLQAGEVRVNSHLNLGPFKDGTFKEVVVRSIQTNRVSVDVCTAETSVCFALRAVKSKDPLVRTQIRRGMVLVDLATEAKAYRSFTAHIAVLHHASTIAAKYQAVVHCGNIRQSACIEKIDVAAAGAAGESCLRNGDKALVRFKFMVRGEFIRPGQMFVFREGTTKGVGRIAEVFERSLDQQAPASSFPIASVGKNLGKIPAALPEAHKRHLV